MANDEYFIRVYQNGAALGISDVNYERTLSYLIVGRYGPRQRAIEVAREQLAKGYTKVEIILCDSQTIMQGKGHLKSDEYEEVFPLCNAEKFISKS